MAFSSWIRNWKRSIERRWALYHIFRRKSVARRRATRPCLEALEDRRLLSANTYLVNLGGDAGTSTGALSGDIRYCINQADQSANAGSTITFDTTAIGSNTITLSGSELAISDNMTIQGPGASNLTISGNKASRVFDINSSTAVVSISGLTISDGSSSSTGGGGVYNSGSLTVSGCTLSDNSSGYGGGIANYFSGSLTVSNSTLSDNSSTNEGGGIASDSDGNVTISGCTLSGNSAVNGGGIFNAGTMTVSGNTLSSNSASHNGGGIVNNNTLTLSDSTLSGNTSSQFGGGISNGGTLTASNSTLSDNSATFGGGGIENDSTLTLSDSTLDGNTAGQYGGGIANNGPLTVSNSTLSGNSAGDGGGGIFEGSGDALLHNTIVAGNLSGSKPSDVYGNLNLDSASDYNLIGDGSGGLSTVNHNLLGSSSSPLDPLLAPLGNYGGSTQTMALLPGSLAIDAGSSAYGGSTDQRGEPRVGATDIGAFESQGFTVAVSSGNYQSALLNTAFAQPLVVAVTANNALEPVAGGQVTFTAPASGASAALSGSPAVIGSNGKASATATANGSAGNYAVIASATGIASPASFSLTNLSSSTYVVTSTADDGSPGTLRYAINSANASGGAITEIDFNIGTSGSAQTISLTSQLPALATSGVFINGLSQGGSGNTTPLITLDGTNAGGSSDGLLLQGSNDIVSGLVIENFKANGIEVDGANNTIGGTTAGAGNILSGNTKDGVLIDSGISGVAVQGNYIGTDTTGSAALANSIGIAVFGSNNTIGGTSVPARNIISGNSRDGVLLLASGVTVQGNFIGTDVSGTKAVHNGVGVEVSVSGNVLGSTATGAGNVISGNSNDGVVIDSGVSGVTVQGNFIGTDWTGTIAVSNGVGVSVLGSGNIIGGTTKSAANVISGNGDGVFIFAGSGIQVQGNLIGTDVTGTKSVGNSTGVLVEAINDTIGGTAAGAGNVISGNKNSGVVMNDNASGIAVQGNYIGTDITGTNALANSFGINDTSANNNTLGGAVSGARNIISGNTSRGIYIDGSSGVLIEGNYIGTDLNGSNAVGNAYGIYDLGASTTIGGTTIAARNVISGNTTDGVYIFSAPGLQLQGNFIGTDATGANAVGNGVGVEDARSNNTIGGSASGAGNVISGNSTDGVLIDSNVSGVNVQGNYIGTDGTGATGVGNGVGIVVNNTNNTIGGTVPAARNIISGNRGDGVLVNASGVTVQGNYIGTDVLGSVAIANSIGIQVSVSGNTIGGAVPGAGNVISGNTTDGVSFFGISSVTIQGNLIGTDATGTKAVANSIGVLADGSSSAIGGTTAAARNIISGNSSRGVYVGSASVQVLGNYIGTDLTGTKAVANGTGIETTSINITIGGAVAAAGNVISGNSGDGLFLTGASGVTVQGNLIGTDWTGTLAVGNNNGVEVNVSNDVIGGAVSGARNIISGNKSDGIFIDPNISGVSVQGNYIGTDITGTKAVGNNFGVHIVGSGNTVGGTTTSAANLISGNNDGVYIYSGTGIQVLGNSIGTDLTGTLAVGNNNGIIASGTNNTIGGTTATARNIISGNSADGVQLNTANVTVQGNFIGTDVTGTLAVANSIGILANPFNNTIGGTATGAGNLISGNSHDGVLIKANIATGVAVQGNWIGTDVNGTKAVANSVGIEVAGANNTIGGTVSGSLNVISGNTKDGVLIDNGISGVQVQGNYIGTDVNGSVALANSIGIEVAGNTNTIGGTAGGSLNVISGNSSDGVLIDSKVSGVLVQGNFIGTDKLGAASVGNNYGIYVVGPNNTVGGNSDTARNIISGNTEGVFISGLAFAVQVQGNYIGTDANGATAVANSIGIDVYGNKSTVGGTTSGEGNVISGNSDGVEIQSSGYSVQVLGNDIGTDATGTKAVSNNIGVYVAGSYNTVGGAATGARNTISGNTTDGVRIDGSNVQVQGNFIGTDLTGLNAVSNSVGVEVAGSANTIGGNVSGAGNIISGNQYGALLDSSASAVLVLGNSIGTDVTGAKALANSVGIEDEGPKNTIGGAAAGTNNVISGNSNEGVLIASGSSGVTVQGNYIGTDLTGTIAVANSIGVEDAGSGNTLGGSTLDTLNIISGNSSDGVLLDSGATGETVQGNYIGLSISGTTVLANSANGIEIKGTNNTIGGNSRTNVYVRNFISGNGNDGVLIDSGATGNQVQGNYIGLDISGTNGVGNVANGIEVAGNSNTLGSAAGGAGNFISGNSKDGVLLFTSASGNQVQGNYIGINITSTAVSNSNGVEAQGTGNTIGGSVSGAANVISGNKNDGVLIDSGATGNVVEGNNIGLSLSGSAAIANSIGIEVAGNSNTLGASYAVAPNVISGNTSDGIRLDNTASGNQVLGNYIGTNAAGTAPFANMVGIVDQGSSNIIGGSVLGARNVISGNTSDGVLIDTTATKETMQGNYIGLNVNGSTALANGTNGVEVKGVGNLIGGSSGSNYYTRNFISGNTSDGVLIDSGATGNQVQGNFIGVGVSGTNGVGNVGNGIGITSNSNTIGGTTAGLGNVISGSGKDGLLLDITAKNNLVQGNDIGTDYTGKNALGNSINGIEVVDTGNTLGGSVAGARNILAGNSSDGVRIDSGASGTVVQGNFIGINAGNTALANSGNGINVASTNNTIGGTPYWSRNFISGNSKDGVLFASSASGNVVLGNYIGISGINTAVSNSNGIEVQGTLNTIGGSAAGSYNVISGNKNDGVLIDSGASGNVVEGNNVGLNIFGKGAVANSGNGIEVTGGHNTVGASYAVAPNVISGNVKDGVLLDNSYGNEDNQVLGNYIGTNPAGTAALANNVGIEDNGLGNTIGGSVLGARNIISGNTGDGVLIDSFATGEKMQGNYIGLDVSGNTAVANGGNGVEIQGAVAIIGGDSGANYFVRNFISGNAKDGVLIDSSAGSNGSNQVQGNFIGVGVKGTNGLGNLANGVEITGSTPNTIGGTSSGFTNVISDNGNGGISLGSKAIFVLIQGNYVGTDYTGTSALGNSGNGISIAGNSNTVGGTVSGAGNIIANNAQNGVVVNTGTGNTISRNSIFADTGAGISLTNSGNNNLAAPTSLEVSQSGNTLNVTGNFTAPTANVNYVLEFFANPGGDPEGKIYLGSLTVKPTSTGTQAFPLFTATTAATATNPLITATLTDSTGDTSAFSLGASLAPTWSTIGPTPIVSGQIAGGGPVSGRVTGIAADPKNANIVYVASAGGGIWKSTNATAATPTWTALTDNVTDSNGNPIPQFMGAVAQTEDSSGNQIVYAGTGEANNGSDCYYGVGILVSKNGGSTWTLTTGPSGAFNGETVSKMVIDPSDSTGGTAYAAVSDFGTNGTEGHTGIWKTTDFGQTWTNTTAYLDTTPGSATQYEEWSDIVIDPLTPSTLYAAQGTYFGGYIAEGDSSTSNGVYKSTDGGSTWNLLTNCPNGTQDGRISLGLYDDGTTSELIVAIASPSSNGLYKMEKSTDGGSTFSDLTNNSGLSNYLGSQGWYDTTLAVDPSNANYIFAAGDMSNQGPTFSGSPLESFDGGNTWQGIATDSAGKGPHSDAHATAFDANGNLLEGDDGGIFRLNNPANSSTQRWSDLNTNLEITQFYGIAADTTVSNVVYGGAQDNGTLKYTSSSGWTQIFSGDGGITRVDPANHNVIYQEYVNVYLQVSTTGGTNLKLITSGIQANTEDFIVPYVLDASGNIYYGTDYLNFSSNEGTNWSQIGTPGVSNFNPAGNAIHAIAVNPVANSNVVYVSTGGDMFVTQNSQAGGSSVIWTKIDLPNGAQSGSNLVHNSIAIDPSDSTGGTAYAVAPAFTGASSGHIFKTTNFGSTWTDISGNLPDSPADSVAVSPDGKTVYVGTDVGVYSSSNGGTSWAKFGIGLPNAMVMEIEVVPSQNLLVIGTHGRGVWEIPISGSSPPASSTQPQQPITTGPATVSGINPIPAPPGNIPLPGTGDNIAGSAAQGDSLSIDLTGTSAVLANTANSLTTPSLNSPTLSGSTPTATPADMDTQSSASTETTSTAESDSLSSAAGTEIAEDASALSNDEEIN